MRGTWLVLQLAAAALVAAFTGHSGPTALAAPEKAPHRIALSRIGPVRTGLFIADADGRSERSFTSNRDGGDFNIYTVKVDGSDVRRLTDSHGNDSHSAWSADGEWILFSSSRKGYKDEAPLSYRIPQPYGELFVMRSDGSEVRQLTDNQWEDGLPAWMPEKVSGNARDRQPEK